MSVCQCQFPSIHNHLIQTLKDSSSTFKYDYFFLRLSRMQNSISLFFLIIQLTSVASDSSVQYPPRILFIFCPYIHLLPRLFCQYFNKFCLVHI